MADEKPKPPSAQTQVETLIGILFILMIVGIILERLYAALTTGELTFFGYPVANIGEWFRGVTPIFRILSFSLSGLFVFGIIVFAQLRGTLLIQENKNLYPKIRPEGPVGDLEENNPMADRWKQVLEHVASEHPSDWRLAIIEADVMLDELLRSLMLPGDTMGDKLKAVERSDFLTIDEAWEAHKIRNQIAHEGSEFLLNQREARRVIDLYARVFKEFHLV